MHDIQVRYSGRFIDLVERENWEYASRVHRSGIAVIIAVTEARELLLVEQFRIPVQSNVIELPAGLIGDTAENFDESGLDAAVRELEEETGFHAGEMEKLIHCPTTAGLADEMATFYLAGAVEQIHSGGGDASEQIVVHIIPLTDIDMWLDQQGSSGKLLDPKIYSALYWLQQRGI